MEFHEKIKKIRIELKISQKRIAEEIGVAKSTYSLYETGAREPDVEKIKKIAVALNTTPDELLDIHYDKSNRLDASFVKKYNSLDERGKEAINLILDFEYEQSKKRKPEKMEKIPVKFPVQYFSLGASAGTGNYLDYTISSIEYIDEEPPAGTDYMLKVTGDSMEPTYYDGDYVFVNRDEKPKFGEIGIFWYDGCVYIKEYGRDGLISHNPNYDIIKADNTMSCMGKVIGKIGG